MDQVSESKLTATQNVIRDKFEKAYTNRVEHEQDVNRVMNRLTAIPQTTLLSMADDLEFKNNDFFIRNPTKTTNDTPQLRLSNKSYSIHAIKSSTNKTNREKHHDPNALCDNLRIQLSSLLAGDMNSMHLINEILDELRDLNIIV